MLLGNALLFVLSLIVMVFLSPLLTLIALAVGPALLVLSIASRRRLFPASWDAQQQAGERGRARSRARSPASAWSRASARRSRRSSGWRASARCCTPCRVRAVRLMARYSPALPAIPALGQVGVLALGGWLAISGEITLGTFLAFSSYLAQMVDPVRALTGLITIGQEARASVIRVFEVIDSRPVLTEKPDAPALPAGQPGRRAGRRALRLRALRAGAARAVAAGPAGRDAGRGRHLGLGQVHDLAAAPPLLRRALAARSGSAGTTSAT